MDFLAALYESIWEKKKKCLNEEKTLYCIIFIFKGQVHAGQGTRKISWSQSRLVLMAVRIGMRWKVLGTVNVQKFVQ